MESLRELALFAGAGGGLLASLLLKWRTVCAVEIDPYCRARIFDRQRDGYLPRFPIWDDIRTFDGRPWRGAVDVVSGGFPCQDISAAGHGTGITGKRSGLVFEMLRIVNEVRPVFVFAENSPHLRTKGLSTIVKRFISMGYVGRVGVLGAGDIGANHRRKRMWIVAADTDHLRRLQSQGRVTNIGRWLGDCTEQATAEHATDSPREQVGYGRQSREHRSVESANSGLGKPAYPDCDVIRKQPRRRTGQNGKNPTVIRVTDWWNIPRFARMDDGLADRMERVKATGNGQVSSVAALAWTILTSDFYEI